MYLDKCISINVSYIYQINIIHVLKIIHTTNAEGNVRDSYLASRGLSVRAGAGHAGLRTAPPEFVRRTPGRTPIQSPARWSGGGPALPGSEQAAGLCDIEYSTPDDTRMKYFVLISREKLFGNVGVCLPLMASATKEERCHHAAPLRSRV